MTLRTFSLRSMLLVVTLVAMLLGFWNAWWRPLALQQRALEQFADLDAEVLTADTGPRWIQRQGNSTRVREIVTVRFPPAPAKSGDIVRQIDCMRTALAKNKQSPHVRYAPRPVTDTDLVLLPHLRRLKYLDVSHSQVGNAALGGLPHRAALVEFRARFTRISDEGLHQLSRAPQLEVLDLSGCAITDAGIDDLLRCESLKELYLDHTRITSDSVRRLLKLPHLEQLSVFRADVDLLRVKWHAERHPNVKVHFASPAGVESVLCW